MSSYARMLLTSPLTSAQLASQLNLVPGQLPALQNLENYLSGLSGGNQMALLEVDVNPVYAYATLTSTGTATAGETFVLCNVTFTAEASGATGNQFDVSATPATQAANIAAAINGSSNLAGKVTAEAVEGVVTITSALPGLIGNGLQISEGLTNVTLVAFAHGTDGSTYDLDFR